jgi:2-aminobenzoate-CoA ligase
MYESPSAHVDTFARDHLPSPEEWPELVFELPELRYPSQLNCGAELLDASIVRFGGTRPAFLAEDGQSWSYGELRTRVDSIAHILTHELGVRPGTRVLLSGPNSPGLGACWLAVMKAGGVAVTVPAGQRATELSTICAMARVRHALCDERSLEELEKAQVPGLRVLSFGGVSSDDLLRRAANEPAAEPYAAVDTAADDVALIAFTSGTTGRPKGCIHLHRDVLAIADTFSAQVLRPRPDDVFAGSPPLGFTFGLGGLLVFPLRAGASTLLMPWSGAQRMAAAITRHQVSVLFATPTGYRHMLTALEEDPDSSYDISSLRRCVSAGEHLSADTWHAWHNRVGLPLINAIGCTELLHVFLSAADQAARPGSLGRPVPGWQVQAARLGSDGRLRAVPDGEPGRLAVRGPVGCRYLADPRQGEYVRDGWNLTGDTVVREPDGSFRYVARNDDMIISAGYNIAGPEVEEALLRHPDVEEAAVVGRPDGRRGQTVVAHVVLRRGEDRGPAMAEALRDFVKGELAPYKCPRDIVFTASLPRTSTGKVQRVRLRESKVLIRPGTVRVGNEVADIIGFPRQRQTAPSRCLVS